MCNSFQQLWTVCTPQDFSFLYWHISYWNRMLDQDISIWPFSNSQSTLVYVAALQNNCSVSHCGWRKCTFWQSRTCFSFDNHSFLCSVAKFLYYIIIDVLPVPDSFWSALKSIKNDLNFSYEPLPTKPQDQYFAKIKAWGFEKFKAWGF